MNIRQTRVVIRAKNFDRSCRFYAESLALPRLDSWEGDDLKSCRFQAGPAVIEILGRAAPGRPSRRDEQFDYQGPEHKMVLIFEVPSAEKAYEELLFRDKNIPGGLRRGADGAMIFETHDPDGVKIVFRQPLEKAGARS